MFQTSVSAAMMEKSLSGLWQRQQLIAHNIANEDTPGFKAKRLAFEDALRREINSASRVTAISRQKMIERVEGVSPKVYEDKATATRTDGNNVDKLNEQIEQARVQIQYNALQRKINAHYSTLKYAINGGR